MGSKLKKVTAPWVAASPDKGRKLTMVTAYDYRQGRLVDDSGAEIVLVGDSLAMVVLGHDDTMSVTMDEMLHHTKAVRRGVERALLVADMPYGSFHLSADQAVANALRFVKEAGAEAVKIEGARAEVVAAIAAAEVPVMAHLGLTPQSVNRFGGFKIQGRGASARKGLIEAALEVEAAGAFSLVLECVPADLATEISQQLAIPTIGIGAGAGCDGQVLVYHDLLGLEDRLSPKFVRRYAELGRLGAEALEAFVEDVRAGRFPADDESYEDPTLAEGSVRKLYG
jgi:3-methyl-2-oxobutanoate hydroxymethyltransferase